MKNFLGSSSRGLKTLLLFGIVLLLIASTSLIVGTQLEAHDSFCASCHVQPEESYYQASLRQDEPETLAVIHAGLETRCIDCHSRSGVLGRIWAQLGGMENLVAFRSGNYRDPSSTTRPVGDGGCSKCHGDLTWVSERPGHYHSPELRRRWRAFDGPANTCQACHPAHDEGNFGIEHIIGSTALEEQCEGCHEAFGIGENE